MIGVGIVGIAIRMELHRDPAISLLDLFFIGASIDAEHLIIVAF
jgi:hypothetical protein